MIGYPGTLPKRDRSRLDVALILLAESADESGSDTI